MRKLANAKYGKRYVEYLGLIHRIGRWSNTDGRVVEIVCDDRCLCEVCRPGTKSCLFYTDKTDPTCLTCIAETCEDVE